MLAGVERGNDEFIESAGAKEGEPEQEAYRARHGLGYWQDFRAWAQGAGVAVGIELDAWV